MPMLDTANLDPVALKKAREWTEIEKAWMKRFVWIQHRVSRRKIVSRKMMIGYDDCKTKIFGKLYFCHI